MLILPQGTAVGRGDIVVDLSIGKIILIFLINGFVHLCLVHYLFVQKGGGAGKGSAGSHRVRLLVFFTLQAMVQIAWSEYKNMTFVLFLVVVFSLVLFASIFFDNYKKIAILNIFSFGVNLVFANFFNLFFLLIFSLFSRLLIYFFAKRTCWIENAALSSIAKKQHWE